MSLTDFFTADSGADASISGGFGDLLTKAGNTALDIYKAKETAKAAKTDATTVKENAKDGGNGTGQSTGTGTDPGMWKIIAAVVIGVLTLGGIILIAVKRR
ncbi:hypothetical protein Ga0100231_005330 [Opitutaceae bacterium TAV4]|nr:hypothetical protein Ga0100231_005330 [Opitutaceae bacterium TAV4]RRK02585.1 hypothetical protein Ga0100230_005580 [Opitutaceae bacterium TAV3]